MLSILTCTRNRAYSFSLLERYFLRREYKAPVEWVVVNDGTEPYSYTCGQRVIQRTPQPGERHSLCENMLVGLDACKGDWILIMEDDDWYSFDYILLMSFLLGGADLVGLSHDYYYYLRKYGRGQLDVLGNVTAASLATTGFTRAVVPLVKEVCEKGHPIIDNPLWAEWGGKKELYDNRLGPYHVGLKGGKGEPNITKTRPRGRKVRLAEVIGDDAAWYK